MNSFRKVIFWLHLIAGCLAGVLIAILCLTGAILVYQSNIESMTKPAVTVQPITTPRLTLDQIMDKLRASGQGDVFEFVVHNGDNQPVEARWGHTRSLYLDPWTGEVVPQHSSNLMHTIFWFSEQIHVGLGQSKRTGVVGPFLVHAATLLCLILFITGVYLWLPSVFSKPAFKARFFFKKGLQGRPRDLNWHNVFGIWTTIPMLVILITGLVWSYPWAQRAVYFAMGAEAPRRGGHAPVPVAPGAPAVAGGHGAAAPGAHGAAAGTHGSPAEQKIEAKPAGGREAAAAGERGAGHDAAQADQPAARGEGHGGTGRDTAAGGESGGRGEGHGGARAEGGAAPRQEAAVATPAPPAESKPAKPAAPKPAAAAAKTEAAPEAASAPAAPVLLPLEQLSNITKGLTPDWENFSLPIPRNGVSNEPEEVMIFAKNGFFKGGPEGMTRIELDYHTGQVTKLTPFRERDMALKLHAWMKSFHTLSEFGPIGQIIAVITCLAGILLVWTGYALSIRRFLNWRQRRKAAVQAA